MTMEGKVPGFDKLEGMSHAVGFATLSMIPAIGGAGVEIASGLVQTRQAQRQHDFNLEIARAIDALRGAGKAPDDSEILESDEFMAAYERASRTAAESSSTTHRRRLAWAAAQMGAWSDVSSVLRQQMFARVNEMEDAHVRVLSFANDPRAFIANVAPTWNADDGLSEANLMDLIIDWVFAKQAGSDTLAHIIRNYLDAHGLAQLRFENLPADLALSCHTTELGRELLHFIEFPES